MLDPNSPLDNMPQVDASDELRMGSARASSRKAAQGEMTIMWVVLALFAIVGVGFAITHANPAAPPPSPPMATTKKADPPTPRVSQPRVASKSLTPNAASPKVVPEPTVVKVEEAPQKKAVDPIEGFNTGEAFDNPASPGQYGRQGSRRSSGLVPSEANGATNPR